MSFTHLQPQPLDPLLSIAREAVRDQRPGRIDLSIGVYRRADGTTPVMRAVKQAEAVLLETQTSKAYLSVEGDRVYLDHVERLLLGSTVPGRHVTAMQTPGGTGALRLAADLLARGRPGRAIWVGTPTWSNHMAVFAAAGLDPRPFVQFDAGRQRLVIGHILEAIERARPGDAILIQPVCQNPTGTDPSPAELKVVSTAIAARGLVPLIDIAYHGFGDGLAQDAARVRAFVATVPDALIAYSCNKNFGLYRERVGALFGITDNQVRCDLIGGNLQTLARASYSMPPDHGAAIVRTILESDDLTRRWMDELVLMSNGIKATRCTLAAYGRIGTIDLSAIASQSGMFSMLPLDRMIIARLRQDHAIYMAENGRINLAALDVARVPDLVGALDTVQLLSAA